MPVLNLTKTAIDALPYSEKQTDYFDTGVKGFGLRVGKAAKTFILRKTIGGKPATLTIGSYGAWTPDKARARAKELITEIDRGVDPRIEKQRRAESGPTVEMIFRDYLSSRSLKDSTRQHYTHLVERYLAPWLNRPISEITKAEVRVRFKEISDLNGPASANLAMVFFGGLWSFAHAEMESSPASPTTILTATKTWNPRNRKTDRLSFSQFSEFTKALQFLRHPLRDAFTLVLHTGLRSEEAAGLLWENVDFREGTFIIPDTKNGTTLTLPMSGPVRVILERRRDLKDGSVYAFAGQGKGGNVALLSRTLKGLGFKDLTVHGLRRTFRSVCESLAIPTATIKALMNHSLRSDITDSYLEIPVEQLRPWSEKISTEVERLSNV